MPHHVEMQITVLVPEGSIAITGEEVYFSFEPVRPRHVRLAANIGDHLREIARLAEHHRASNPKADPEACQKEQVKEYVPRNRPDLLDAFEEKEV